MHVQLPISELLDDLTLAIVLFRESRYGLWRQFFCCDVRWGFEEARERHVLKHFHGRYHR